jgi:O-antigen ligase
VLASTVFSWFNLNSYCIILFVACALWEYKFVPFVRAVFSNPLYLAYFLYFLIEAAGLLHTHNMKAGVNILSKDATLVAIASVLCTGTFAGKREYGQLMTAYCGILVLSCCYCLVVAARTYLLYKDSSVFFYHPLTAPISQNAVFFSVYVLFGLQFLLFVPGGEIPFGISRSAWKAVKISGIVFFIVMIVLLSSKLFLVLALVMLVAALLQKVSFRKNRRIVVLSGVATVLLIGLLVLTDNPVKARYQEIAGGDLDMIKTEQFNPGTAFNGLQLRLLEYHFAYKILNEQHAWLFGVSPGDSQDLLDRKYIDANMYIGNPADGPHRKIRGFIGYNFHNQFVETLVRLGWIGLLALLVIFGLLIGLVVKYRTPEAFFTVLTLVLFFIPEAPLTLQQGIFLFCFFPLLLPYTRKLPE